MVTTTTTTTTTTTPTPTPTPNFQNTVGAPAEYASPAKQRPSENPPLKKQRNCTYLLETAYLRFQFLRVQGLLRSKLSA